MLHDIEPNPNTGSKPVSNRAWTVDDVQALVREAGEVVRLCRDYREVQHDSPAYKALVAALAPFTPDPDAELVEKIVQAMYQASHENSDYATARACLNTVREHDRERSHHANNP